MAANAQILPFPSKAEDTITILRSIGTKPTKLTKQWTSDGEIKHFANALMFVPEIRKVGSLADLQSVLSEIEEDSSACVVRGVLKPDWRKIQTDSLPEWNKGRDKPIAPTGDRIVRRGVLFDDAPHQWMMVDVDNFAMHIEECYERAILRYVQTLPAEFHEISCYWQLSASCGHPTKQGVLKAHLWFWLDRPTTSAELKAWAAGLPPGTVDSSLYQTVQIHYTAAPDYEPGVKPPNITRSGAIDGLLGHSVSLVLTDEAIQRSKAPTKSRHDLIDPRTKPGIIGAFHRVYSVEHVVDEFLPGHFEWAEGSTTRLTWTGGNGTAEGVVVRADRLGLVGSHDSWPGGPNKAHNLWDLVRIFKFGHLDAPTGDALDDAMNEDATRSNSQEAMMEWAKGLPKVAEEIERENREYQERRRAQMAEAMRIGEGTNTVPYADPISLESALNRFIYVGDGSGVYDRKNPSHYLPFAEFRRFYAASYEKHGKVKVSIATQWAEHPDRSSVMARSFKAGAGLFIRDPEGRDSVNTWVDFDRSGYEINHAHVDTFISHIEFIFGSEAQRFLNWLAHIEQRPGELPHTAWLSIATNTGLGRNWISSVLARVWAGRVAANFDLLGMFEKGFNGRLAGKILACVDEIKAGGNVAWPHSEKLKSIVTEEIREVNPKYGKQFVEYNAVRFLIFSNHIGAIPLEINDRRWEVVINEGQPLSSTYYSHIYGMLKQPDFIRSIAAYLMTHDISGFNPGAHAKATESKNHVINTSKSDIDLACEALVNDWPSDVIFSSDLSSEVFGESRERKANFIKSAMPRFGARPYGPQVKVSGVPVRAWILRNLEKWVNADKDAIRNEGLRGRELWEIQMFDEAKGNASTAR